MAALLARTGPRHAARRRRPRDGAVVELREVSKVFPGGEVGLDRVRLRIARGELAFLVGPSGSGKTTCLRMLVKEVEPSDGEVLVAGRRLSELPRRRLPHLRRDIGIVFPDGRLLPDRTSAANLSLPLAATGERGSALRARVAEVLALVGLDARAESYPAELSSAEQRRLSVARAFASRPPLLLADEPAGGLDPETSIAIMQLLHRINRTGTTVLVATRDRELVRRLRRRTIELRDGRVVGDRGPGSPEEPVRVLAARLRRELALGAGRAAG